MAVEVSSAATEHEQRRITAVQELDLLDTPSEERFDRITRIAKELFSVPIVGINLVDEDRLFTKSPQSADRSSSYPRSQSFCDVTVQGSDVLVIPDASLDDRFASRDMVTGPLHVRFYAGRPLSLDGDLNVGSLCLIGPTPRTLDEADRQLLDEMGTWVERELRETAERDRAADIQRGLLPQGRPGWPDFDVAGLSIPMQQVSGDFFAWHETPAGIDLTVADVMGKGSGAAIIGASIRSAFQARIDTDPATAVDQVNTQLIEDLDATGTFATLFHAQLDFTSGLLSYADAGHGLTVIIHPDRPIERLQATGLPLGFANDVWQATSVTLAPGDTLLSFTDGVLDLFDGTLASVDRLCELAATGSARDILARIRALVSETPAVTDDVTIVVVARRH